MRNINNKLSDIIERLLLKTPTQYDKNIFFDEFEAVLLENKIHNIRYFLILNLIDFYEDAINHNFERIDEKYTINQAKNDLIQISNILKSEIELESQIDLNERLTKLFS